MTDTTIKTEPGALLLLAVILLIAVAAYINSLNNEFLWDDKALIVDNPLIQNWGHLKKNLVTHLYHGTTNASNFYRPLLKVSFMADYSIWKNNAAGWRATNIILHALNAGLVFLLLSLILRDKIAAFTAGLLFAVHPLFVPAVAYISGRADPMSLFFGLLSFLLFIKHRDFLSLLFFILAILTKEMAIIIPALFLLYIRVFKDSKSLKRFYPYVAVIAVYATLRLTVFNFPFVPTLTSGSSPYLRLITMSKIVFIYLRLLALPLGLHMERNVPYSDTIFKPEILASVIALAAMAFYVAKRVSKDNKNIFFGVLWFFIALIPISNIMPLNMSMAEHWMYLPSIGLFACAGLGVSAMIGRGSVWRMAAYICLISVIIFYFTQTVIQNRTWKDEKSFYKNLVKYVPDSYVGRNSLGDIYLNEGKVDLAIKEYMRSLEIMPHYVPSHMDLAGVYIKQAKRREAIWHCERAAAYFPTLSEPHYRLGIIYEYNTGNVRYGAGFLKDKAILEYKTAIRLNPEDAWAHYNLAVVYEFSEDGTRYADRKYMELAKEEYRRALEIDPYHKKAKANLEILVKRLKKLDNKP